MAFEDFEYETAAHVMEGPGTDPSPEGVSKSIGNYIKQALEARRTGQEEYARSSFEMAKYLLHSLEK